MTTALIDADIVAYRCSAASENEPVEVALVRTDELIRRILLETKSDTYKTYLTGSDPSVPEPAARTPLPLPGMA